MRRRTAVAFALPILAITLGLAACSGGTPSAGSTSTAGGSDSKSYEQEFDDWSLKFAKCLREQGMDVADPAPGTQWTYPNDPGADAAVTSCTTSVGSGPSPADDPNQPSKAERVEQGLKLAKCLREKGYDVKDPDENGAVEVPDGLGSGSLAGTGCENL